MPATESTASPRRSVDENGRALALSPEEAQRRASEGIAALQALESIGDEDEQRRTLDALIKTIDEDRSSYRKRFR